MSDSALNAWIHGHRARGLWVSCCPSCGAFFAQERTGRRAMLCGLHRCYLWRRWRILNGAAPPEWMALRWLDEYANEPRHDHPAKQSLLRFAA